VTGINRFVWKASNRFTRFSKTKYSFNFKEVRSELDLDLAERLSYLIVFCVIPGAVIEEM
jgi:hypothetical protein